MPRTPDIPQNIFFEDKAPTPPKMDPSPAISPAGSQSVIEAKSQDVKRSSSQKVQVTVYLSEETAKGLERARFELLSKHNVKVPKSAIAEYAIATATLDLEAMASALGGGR